MFHRTRYVSSVFRHLEGYEDVRLRRQVVDLRGPNGVDNLGDAGAVTEVAVVQTYLGVPLVAVRICAQVTDPAVVDVRTEAEGAVDLGADEKICVENINKKSARASSYLIVELK